MGTFPQTVPRSGSGLRCRVYGLLAAVISDYFHVIQHIFSPILSRHSGLRKRAHPCFLPTYKDIYNFMHNVLIRSLLPFTASSWPSIPPLHFPLPSFRSVNYYLSLLSFIELHFVSHSTVTVLFDRVAVCSRPTFSVLIKRI